MVISMVEKQDYLLFVMFLVGNKSKTVLVRIKSDSDFGKSDFSLTGDFSESTLFSD